MSIKFASEGASIVVNDLDTEAGKANAKKTAEAIKEKGGKAVVVLGDITEKENAVATVEKCVEEWGKIDILINNAWGGGQISRLEWKGDEEIDHAFTIGPKAAFWTMMAAFPHMKKANGGSIINFGSLNGVNAHVFTVDYNMCKEAIRSLTRTAAVEWGRFNIRCNVICPAAATESYEAFKSANPEIAEVMRMQNPMQKMGDPIEDIGGVALFLATDDSKYLTGNTLFVDGGSHVNGVSWKPEMPEELPEK